MVETLLQNGADALGRDARGWTPLHYLCCNWNSYEEENNIRILLALTASSVIVDQPDLKGRTPLMLACDRGCSAAIVALLRSSYSFRAISSFC